ncbi:hypothetical protein [Kitasatospora azatica]|uniref:hypothetical protein n=1 Tax=Kitasatospora azatica TaxID=58347 RepID=UPI00055A762E|nr:hypothetical protein [Kitasatospora azatica]
MRVNRSAHPRKFIVLPNGLLQDRRLSYTARGLLADLLSRPDGWREDGRQMADSSPQGRGAIRKALRELTDAGYYRVVKRRMPDGTIRSEAHVFDTPQRPELPGVPRPVAGEATTGPADAPLVKNLVKEPSLPATRNDEPSADAEAGKEPGGEEEGHDIVADTPAAPDEEVRTAVLTLFRVIKPEPRLPLGEAEAMELAPLVAQWLQRGSTPGELAQALLPGLPTTVHSPVGVLRSRLERKMPPVRVPEVPGAARYAECAKCHDPVSQPGICGACAGLGERQVAVGRGADVTLRGAARVRAAMRLAKPGLSSGQLAAAR